MRRVMLLLAAVVLSCACGHNPVGVSDAECYARGFSYDTPGMVLLGKRSGSGVQWIAVEPQCVGAWDRAGYTER